MSDLRLGPFVLQDRLARGGMASVWRAVHEPSSVAVAVKVASARAEGAHPGLFDREVRAVAALHHPSVIWIADHGAVPAEVAALAPDDLDAGAPYLVMELASAGTLSSRSNRPRRWSRLRETLLATLDALAHAHARGIVHRDIKPSNLLLCAPTDPRPGLKLADFGIAHFAVDAQHPVQSDDYRGGTPHFMAPEQVLGRWRRYGPWTDLYALGCVAWYLATGFPVFHGKEGDKLLEAQIRSDPGELQPAFPVPAGFDGWLRGLLQKSVRARVRRAADAARQLARLPGDDLPANEEAFHAWVANRPTLVGLLSTADDSSFDLTSSPLPDRSVVQVMPDWRGPAVVPPFELVGVGLGLFGLRRPPLVARDAERDLLWRRLREAAVGLPQVVVVEGVAGTGKTALVRWLCERAHELGSGTALRALHDESAGPSHGLGPMLARFFQCADLAPDAALRQIRARMTVGGHVEPELASAVLALVMPGATTADGPSMHFGTSRERFRWLRRALRFMAQVRPLIVWLDNAQWGLDALAFARSLAQDAGDERVLVVLTVRSEAMSRFADRALERIRETATAIDLGPLDGAAGRALVRGFAALDDDLVHQVVERSGGFPLFCEHLIGDWAERGLLEPSPDGLRLRAGSSVAIPDALQDLWVRRLTGFEADLPAIELAAVLGGHPDPIEWREACVAAGLPIPGDLLGRLTRARLVVWQTDHWAFAHDMLVESLIRIADAAGRLRHHHAACARMLEGRPGAGMGRRGMHLIAAGRPREALDPLLQAIVWHYGGLDYPVAQHLAAAWAAASADAHLPVGHPLWVWFKLRSAELARQTGRYDEAVELADETVALAAAHGPPVTGAWGRFVRADVEWLRGGRPVDAFREVLAVAEGLGATALVALACDRLGRVHLDSGEIQEARDWIHRARAAYDALGSGAAAAHLVRSEAQIAFKQGDVAAADGMYRDAAARFARLGWAEGLAWSEVDLGDIARRRRDFDEAERRYLEAIRRFDAIDDYTSLDATLNLATMLVDARQWQRARQQAERCSEGYERLGRRQLAGVARLVLAVCDAADGRYTHLDADIETAAVLIRGLIDPDIAWVADVGGEVAAAAGRLPAARAFRGLALRQWEALGRAEVAATRQALDDLE